MKTGEELKAELLAYLKAEPSKENLLRLIRWLDLEYDHGQSPDLPCKQVIARATIALGYHILSESDPVPTIVTTIKSAQEYALNPTAHNWDSFCFDATRSYPLGPGDGCFSVSELVTAGPCDRGTGCTSAAGMLVSQGIEDTIVSRLLATELIPWLEASGDPVISREKKL